MHFKIQNAVSEIDQRALFILPNGRPLTDLVQHDATTVTGYWMMCPRAWVQTEPLAIFRFIESVFLFFDMIQHPLAYRMTGLLGQLDPLVQTNGIPKLKGSVLPSESCAQRIIDAVYLI